jgi:hypothetical protein
VKLTLLSLAAALALSFNVAPSVAAAPKKTTPLRVRLKTDRGPVYVFLPQGVRPSATVVYVHGYYNNVDAAWKHHQLATKFSGSRLPAVFVVPEAPASAKDAVVWDDLADLLAAVRAAQPGALPAEGPVVAVGHSAAYRTVVKWLSHPRLREVILIDALYGFENEYASWLAEEADRRLVMIVRTTQAKSQALAERFPDAKHLPRLPSKMSKRLGAARLLMIRSQYGHMELVTQPKVLEGILQMSRYAK